MLQPKNKFKPMEKSKVEPLVLASVWPVPQPVLRPRPEDMAALIKSDVEMAFQVECTPDIMRACLAFNTDNYRPLLVGWKNQIQSDMEAKPTRFKRTGDSIQFDVDGLMIDGQHRFEAGVAANFTFVFWFTVGVPKDAREVIGFGRPRKISHVVQNAGYANAYLLSAAAAWLCKIKKGQYVPSGLTRGRNGAGTVEEILDMIKRHPGLQSSVTKCEQKGRQALPGSILSAIHYIGSICLKKPGLADIFIQELRAYPKVKRNGAPFAWIYELEQREQRGLDRSPDFKARGTAEAWNLFMQGIDIESDIEIPEKLTFKDLDYDVL